MAIQISADQRTFTLQTKSSSYQMAVDAYGVLLHLYYGKKIEAENLEYLIYKSDVGFSGNPVEAGKDRTYSLDCLPQELPSSGVGDFREEMIRLYHEDGSCAADFRYEGYEVVKGSYEIPGLPAVYDTEQETGETLIITMREVSSDIKVKLYYGVMEEENVITRSACVCNCGTKKVVLDQLLSCNLDFMFGTYDMIYFYGRHAMERNLERVPVKGAKVEIGSRRGTSSHQYNPAVILCPPETTEKNGDCYGLCFAYSGNFTARAQRDQRNQTRVQMGIQPDQFRFVLEGGETFFAPQVIMSYSSEGFTALSHQYHDLIREHICRGPWKHAKRPALINNWEATYFAFNKEKILKIARQAKELGIEMLVLDDGWFGKRADDYSGLGDWFVNEKKLEGTLAELSSEIHAMGMKFGLWFEPEMVSEDSDLYRAHPDWALQIPGRQPNRARYQLVLDMSRKEVVDYLYNQISDVLEKASVDYVKWDMNRSVCDFYSSKLPAERMGEIPHRFVLGVYDLAERLLKRFPQLLLEGCSGGGGRFDAGMLYYAPQIWCSDNTDAVNRLDIQYGTSFFYPTSTMGAHVSAVPNHQTGRITPFATRGNVAMAGTFGYELDLNLVTDEEKAMVKEQLAQFDRFYDLTHEGDYYRLTAPKEGELMVWEFVAKDKSKAVSGVVKTDAQGNPLPLHVPVAGLAPDRKYHCSYNGSVHTGSVWNNCGLTLVEIPKEYESLLIEWTEAE